MGALVEGFRSRGFVAMDAIIEGTMGFTGLREEVEWEENVRRCESGSDEDGQNC